MRLLVIAALSLCFLQGCKATKIYKLPLEETEPREEDEEPPPAGTKPTTEPEPETKSDGETVWNYLKRKYDADGDDVVSKVEYDRGEEQFKRLDRNGDGQLTSEDVARGRAGRMAQQVLARYFQADDNRRELKFEEIGQAFAKADTDKDSALSLAEFTFLTEAAPQRGGRVPPAGTLYRALVSAVDTDESGSVSQAELEAFFKANDSNDDGVWTMGRRGRRDLHATGVKEGTVAPDFTLKPPGGGNSVTLSSFRGKRPVALIFGSYT